MTKVRDGIFDATLTETYRKAGDLLGQFADTRMLCRREAIEAANMLLFVFSKFLNGLLAQCRHSLALNAPDCRL
jgi:hypothetical protein